MWCIVNLPNGTQQAVKCDPKAIGQECLEKVCKALNIICEMEYFGLEHWTPTQKETRTHQWINLRNRLSQDSGSCSSIQLMLALRVKFWVPVHLILQESARNLFYMQAKVDLIEGRLLAKDWSNAAKLSALLCQADGIRFNEACLRVKCPQNIKNNHYTEQLNHKEKKEKEPVLAFKKRRLSKQKSVESFDIPTTTTVAALSTAIALGTGTIPPPTMTNSSSLPLNNSSNNNNGTQQKQRPQLQRQSYSLGSTASTSASSLFSSILNSTSNHTSNSTTTSTSSPSSTATTNTASTSNNNNNNNPSSTTSSSSSTTKSNNGTSGHCLKNFSFSSSSSTTSSTVLSTSSNSLLQPNNNNNNNSIINNSESQQQQLDEDDSNSPLRIYEDYLIRPTDLNSPYPDEYLRQIAIEHGKLAKLKMSPKSAKYWLLKEIQDLPGYGEEIFSGVTVNENSMRCDVAVGAHGISVCNGDEKNSIPFSAIAAAKSFRRAFKLEYVNDHNERKELEIKLPKHCIAAGLYRSITERHAFYVCDKVRVVVTSQFTRDLKGTIASMFKEDTELGQRYVFDIQRTCREVHDQARRILYERGIEITTTGAAICASDIERYLPSVELINGKVDQAIKEKEDREATIERCVGSRISEAMTCKICMDREINSMFNPCGHVTACSSCAAKCERCPNCRIRITNVVKVFLPTELRNSTLKNHLQQQQPDHPLNDKHHGGVLIEASN